MLTNVDSEIIFNNEVMSSKQINQRLFEIMRQLRKFTTNESVIGIALNRCPDLLISILAAHNMGATFVLLNVNTPTERLYNMISDANIDVLITSKDIKYDSCITINNYIYVENINNYRYLPSNLEAANYNNEIMYIQFTSGTTGNPKGVQISPDAFFNFIDGISEIIDFTQKKRIACLTTVTFDIFLLESIMAFYKGLIIVLANDDEQRNPKLMAGLIHDNSVDMVQLTPSGMQLLLNYDKDLSCLKNVKEIMIGGESFSLNLLRVLQEKTTAKIYNMYGPTETTIWSTISDLTHKDRIDIGIPIKNTEVYIVNEHLSILPSNQVGEICIAGKGLAKGYAGREDLTAEKFTYLPQKPNIKVYQTGDTGRYLPNGDLEYLGRSDNQVKIRGHRIELEEIEKYLNQFDGINQSIVIALETSETDKILEAFYTSDTALNQNDIFDYLVSKLPAYMIPAILKRIENFIQTVNGKIDRKRVLECVEIKDEVFMTKDLKIANTEKLSDIQKRAFEVIDSNLNSKFDSVTLETSFAGAGVDSITFIKIIVALEEEFSFEFDNEMLLITKFPTIRSMIEYVEEIVPLNGKLFIDNLNVKIRNKIDSKK